MSDINLEKLIADLKKSNTNYIPTLAESDEEIDEADFRTCQDTVEISYLVITREKVKTLGAYSTYLTIRNQPGYVADDGYVAHEFVIYDKSILLRLIEEFELETEDWYEEETEIDWKMTDISSRTLVGKMEQFINNC